MALSIAKFTKREKPTVSANRNQREPMTAEQRLEHKRKGAADGCTAHAVMAARLKEDPTKVAEVDKRKSWFKPMQGGSLFKAQIKVSNQFIALSDDGSKEVYLTSLDELEEFYTLAQKDVAKGGLDAEIKRVDSEDAERAEKRMASINKGGRKKK